LATIVRTIKRENTHEMAMVKAEEGLMAGDKAEAKEMAKVKVVEEAVETHLLGIGVLMTVAS
jgi:hypothetical protein